MMVSYIDSYQSDQVKDPNVFYIDGHDRVHTLHQDIRPSKYSKHPRLSPFSVPQSVYWLNPHNRHNPIHGRLR